MITADEVKATVEDRNYVGCDPDCVDYRDADRWIGGVERAEHSSDDYQGDTWVLYQRGDEWGVLTYGWGSCSGCDAALSCMSWEDAAELINRLVDSIVWRTKDDMLAWLVDDDARAGEWDYREGKPFRAKAFAVLRGES